MEEMFYFDNEKVCTKFREIIFNIGDYGLIISTGVENIYFYIISEDTNYSYGLMELYKFGFKSGATNQNCGALEKCDLISRIIRDSFSMTTNGKSYADILNNPHHIELMALRYIDSIEKLNPRGEKGDYLINGRVIKDLESKSTLIKSIFENTFKNEIL